MMKARERTALRAIDANVNRAAEGIRVVEDIVRFMHDDGAMAARFRALRHDLRAAASMMPGGAAALVAARDSRADVARNAPQIDKKPRGDSAASNMKRAQEALRVLEELSKPVGAALSARFGELRFRLYDLERDAAGYLEFTGGPRPIPKGKFLYAVAGFEEFHSGGSFRFLKELIAAGAGMIQLRDKDIDDKALLDRAVRTAKKFDEKKSLYVINDRVDIALAAGADVVHLGQDDMPVAAARGIAGGRIRIGLSSHSYAQAMEGLEQSPDYLAVGPVYASPTKPGGKAVTPRLIERVAAKARGVPIVAIGGITLANLAEVFDAGASGAAMISALTGSENIRKTLASANSVITEKSKSAGQARRRT